MTCLELARSLCPSGSRCTLDAALRRGALLALLPQLPGGLLQALSSSLHSGVQLVCREGIGAACLGMQLLSDFCRGPDMRAAVDAVIQLLGCRFAP